VNVRAGGAAARLMVSSGDVRGGGYALWPEQAKTIPEHKLRALHPQQPVPALSAFKVTAPGDVSSIQPID
jgi:hypothetical protein